MTFTDDLSRLFFHDLKSYNIRCFKNIERADLSKQNPEVYKSCSSVITRYFIFQEKHPEVSEAEMKMLYYKLKIDMIARYFSEYPASSYEDLRPFQIELQKYAKSVKVGDDVESKMPVAVSNI